MIQITLFAAILSLFYLKVFAVRNPRFGASRRQLPRSRFIISLHSASRPKMQSKISLPFFFRIPNPELQMGQSLDPEKPIGGPRFALVRYDFATYLAYFIPELHVCIYIYTVIVRHLFNIVLYCISIMAHIFLKLT